MRSTFLVIAADGESPNLSRSPCRAPARRAAGRYGIRPYEPSGFRGQDSNPVLCLPICGEMRTMPGLPIHPAVHRIDLDDQGRVVGLS